MAGEAVKIPPWTPFVVGPAMGRASVRYVGSLFDGWKKIEFNHPVIVGEHVYHARTKTAAREFARLMGGRG